MPRVAWSRVFAWIILLSGVSVTCYASDGLAGNITDPQGKAVTGAAIRLLLPDGTLVRETTTNSVGEFSFPDLGAGEYRISVSAPGFAVLTRDVSVSGDARARTYIQFTTVQAQSQSVVITAKSIEPTLDLRKCGGIQSHAFFAGRSGFSATECGYQRRATRGRRKIPGNPPFRIQPRSWRRQRRPKGIVG